MRTRTRGSVPIALTAFLYARGLTFLVAATTDGAAAPRASAMRSA
jgi:hypothetical protein